jgi:hypothetical protein
MMVSSSIRKENWGFEKDFTECTFQDSYVMEEETEA